MDNSLGRVRKQFFVHDTNVQIDIGAVKYDLVKDEEGMWTGESALYSGNIMSFFFGY
jgi:hypothetical protein